MGSSVWPAIAWAEGAQQYYTWPSPSGWSTERICGMENGWGWRPSVAFDPADGLPTIAVRCADDRIFLAKREASGSWSLDPVAKTDSQAVLAGLDKPILPFGGGEGFVSEINAFYDTMLEGKTEAVAE